MTSQQDSFGYGLYGKFKLASMAVLLGLTFSVTSYANPNTATTIIADPSAPKNLQPTILPTASGIVSVNIATPNDKGLSNNHYSQFDVGSTGAVLNNNRKAVNTQIAGYVQANPFMAKGEASTILNQINSNNPSHLGGFIEVAGKRADVIIANPNGLVINGTGFINAGNVHLVAANGKFDQGQITGYQVNTGNIEVNGKLNLQNTDYAALIAKTAQINDEIYAGSVLDIVTGENTVTLQDGKFNQLSAAHKNDGASSTNQTGIALDVAALGGMYAGKIRLIGTDKGFGVNNQGMIAATGSGVQAGTGTLTLDHQGNLVNTGIASAKDKVTINTQSHHVHNAGTLLGEQSDIAIDTAKLTNTGTIASTQNTKITATNAIDNQGSMYGGVLQVSTDELTNTGKLVQTGTGKLTISTHTLTNTNKAAIGQSLYEKTQLKAPSVPSTDQSAGMVSHQPADNTTTNNSNNGANTPNPSTDTPSANGFISTTKSLNNTGDKALITATGDTHITANQTSNTNQASIDVQTLNTNTLANTDSKIALDNINWQLTSFDNSKGDIVARDKMVIASQSSIINTEGRLVADSVVLGAKSELDNGDGVVQSAGDVSVTASKVTNNQGIIHGAHALMINANGILTNNAGVISGAQDTTITAKTAIDNADGRIQSDGKLNINTQQLNSTGTIYAAQGTTITASHVNNEQTGLIASAKDVRIDTQSLTSAGTISAGMQSDGKLGNTPANISIQATEGIRSSGNNIATGTLTLNANTINLDDSKTQADHITLLAQDTISTRKTSTVASNSLAITAPNKLDNSEGILSANEVIVNTDVLENRQGAISQAGKTALSLAIKRSIDNTLGTISTNSDKLKIDTNQLINQQGAIHHAGVGELNIKSENLNNSQGELLSLGAQTLNIKAIDNSQGIISATGFTINADGLDNTAGLLQATDKEADNSLNIDSTLDNNKLAKQQGSIDVAGNLTLTAKALQNQGAITANNLKATVANVNNTGAIGARDNIQIASSQDIDNTGNISATGNIVLNANNTISHQGVMMAADSITATANRLNFNQSTSSADNISLSAQADIHHNQGTTVAKDKLSLKNTSTIYNQGGVLSANHASVNTKDLQNGGIIQADVLAIKQQADYKHTDNDKLLANNLQFSTDGKIINQSQLTAGQDLTLSANHIDNTQTGTIKSGNHTQITSQTSINNQGLINGETTVIKANDTINNQSGGRIYGTHLAIQADTLNNTPAKAEQSDGKYTTPVIAARERLDIGVKTLNNNPNPDRAGKFNENFDNQALITSLGSLHIGGSLDDNHYATGKADAVINQGATIESGGEMVVDTKTLLNGNADFKKHKVEVIEESVRKQTLYRAHEQASTIPAAQKSTDTADLDKKPMAGLFDCPPDSDCIINYDNNSVIWTHFGIEPPKEPIPDIKAKDLLDEPELPEGEDAQSCALAGADNQACTQYKEALAHYTKVMGPLLKWEEENSTAIEALQLAIREHNRQFAKSDSDLALNIYTTDEAYLGPTSKKGAPEGALYVRDINGIGRFATEEVDVITTDFVVYEDKTLTSDPARMVAGANLVVYGDMLVNDKSQMSAGAGFLVVGDTVVQTPDNGLYGEKVKQTENGYFTRYTVESSAGGRRHRRVPTNSGAFVQEFAPLDAYQLPILNATINTTPVSTKRPPDALSSNDNQALLDALKANQANLSATAQAQLTALLSAKQSGQAVDEAVLANLVDELKHSITNKQAVTIANTDNTLTIPTSALYTINADNPNQPLIQTDSAFTNHKQWLGSDYMLKALQSDPNHIHKRLSDGYGEQARIKDLYYLLTGRHINTDYQNQEEAYQALMDNGITHAKQFNYTLGTALTPDQMANLTTDIVWLVKQSITYTTKDKDGNSITKIEDVLVPKLYLRSATTDTATLTKDGRLSTISGKNMDIRLTGNLDNNGNFIAKDTMSITADNATNKGVIKGNYVAIETKNNIVNHNQIHADSAARLIAGNDIINESLTTTKQSVVGRSRAKNTAITQIATISVGKGLQGATDENGKPLTTLSLRGNHVLFKAGASHNAGDGTTQITATNGIKLDTVTQTNQLHAVADDNNYFNYDSSKQSGSSVTGVGNVVLAATGENADIDITASQVGSQAGTVALLAQGEGGSVNVEEGRATSQLDSAWLTKTSRAFGSKTEQSRYKQTQDNVVGSQIDGNNILMIADKDITITASQVVGEKQTKLQAGNDITIGSSLNHAVSETSQYRSKSGLMSAGNMGVSIGKEKSAQNTTQTSTTQVGSMVGSLNGDTTIIAKENYTQNVSTVSSPVGDVNIVAGQVTISSKDNTYQSINNSEYEKKGITVSANIPIVNSVQTALNTTKTIGQSSNDRINAMASANAAWQAKKTAEDVGKLVQDASLNTLNPSISISYGQQKSTSQSHTQSTTAQGSQVNAGGQVNIIATGGQDSSIVIAGSDVAGRGGTHLSADHDITITAAKQTQTEDSTNASRGFSVGANISAVGGHSATIGANRGKGNSNSQTTTHIHSHIGDEQSQTTLKAGNQLTLKGAGIKGEEVIVTADKLTMSSLQDTATYHSNQQNVSASATFGTGASVGGDYGKSNIDANYTSVTEQTGIFAGDKGAKVTITGHTDITGAIITSTAKAEQTGKNQFATGTLTISHLDNESYHKGDSLGIGATASISANTLGQTPSPDSKLKATSKANGVSTNGIGYGQDSDHQTSTTQGGIYTQNITITDEAKQADIAKAQGKSVQDIITNAHISTTTTEYQNNGYQATTALTNGFDKDEVQRELDVQVAVTKDFGQNAPKAVADFSEGQRDKYLEQLNNPSLTHEEAKAILDEAQKWEEGGVYRIALHTATGLLATGGVEGALTTGGVATIAPKLDEWQDKITTKLIEQGFEKETAESVSKFTLNLAIATAGTTAGLDTSSTAYALNADMNNRQLHPPEKELAKSLFEKAKREGLKTADGNEYTLEQFEDALRLANHSGYNETYLSNIQESYEQSGRVLLKVHQPATNGDILQDFDLENPYQKWSLLNQSTEDGVTTFNLIQNLGVLHKPDENLVRFIKANDKQDNYSWADGWIQPYRPSIVESHSPNNTPKSTYPDWAIKSRNEFIANNHIDLSSSSQAKSDKLMNERVMPVVETTVAIGGATAITAGCVATGGTLCAVVAGGSIVMAGDTAITQADNFGKPVSQHDTSKLLQGAGLSKDEAQIAKLATEAAMGVGAIKGIVNAKNAKQVAQAQKQIDMARVENNVGRDEDVFYKPIKITGEPKDLKEYNDASKFTYLNDGGEFKFSETKNQQGIEGYFVNQLGDKIPISLKNLETSSPRKVMTVINKNAKSILEAEALPSNNPHKLPIGTLNDTVLHIQTPNISKQQLVDELTNYPFQGNGGKYKIIIFETKDGGFTLQNGKIESYPK
ncbi:hemagglutinin repeat-containing protein (plasmid) [Moraxella bovis]|uniref:two-partner secretion domain-containing protein n=1 Tax=Moraxella bovis TaxID=476 RepID=UPI00223E9937|nr:hemagglutinin repeat-containing protein [Moraxella bovis]UZA55753.1 hemagglutinin repeat-containing protein [Moraxella bovis]